MIVIDCETVDPNLHTLGDGSIRGDGGIITIGLYDGTDGLCVTPDDPRLVDWLASDEDKCFHNAPYDLAWLMFGYGFKIGGTWHDTMTRTMLIDEYAPLSLDECCKKFKVKGKNYSDTIETWALAHGIKNPMGKLDELWMTPGGRAVVEKYCLQDCIATYNLWHAQEPMMQPVREPYELECALLPLVMQMRRNGIRIDTVARDRLTAEIETKFYDTEQDLIYNYGIDRDIIASPLKLGRALNKLDIYSPVKTATGGQSWAADVLDLLDHPVITKVQAMKTYSALLNKYLLGGLVNCVVGDRIHSVFSSNKRDDGGTITGRFASNSPNMQNISARDEKHGQKTYGQEMRSLFLPEDGCMLAAADYNSVEMKGLAHYAKGQQADWFRAQIAAGVDPHKMAQEMTGITSRDVIKRMQFGFVYGMGVRKLVSINRLLFKQIAPEGMDIYEYGQQLASLYHSKMPIIRDTMKAVEQETMSVGYITSIGGRRHHKPKPVYQDGRWNSGIYKMLNYKIQGCQRPDMRIHTTQGMLQFNELQRYPNAEIIIDDATYPFNWIDSGLKHCYELVTAENTSTVLSDKTPIIVYKDNKIQQINIEDIVLGEIIPYKPTCSGGTAVGFYTPDKKNAHNHNIFTINGDADFIWYLFGYILGDGNSTTRGITFNGNPQTDAIQLQYIIDGLVQYGIIPSVYEQENHLTYSFRSSTINSFYETTLNCDITQFSGSRKYIPSRVFTLPIQCRRAIIQAMMDSDGTLASSAVNWVSANGRLANDFIQLLASVGIITRRYNWEYENATRVFIVNRDYYTNTIGFKCIHKQKRLLSKVRVLNDSMPDGVWSAVQPLLATLKLPKGYRNTSETTCLCYARKNVKKLGISMSKRLLNICGVAIPEILTYHWTTIKDKIDVGTIPTNDIEVISTTHLYTSWSGIITHNSCAEILKKGLKDAKDAGIFDVLKLHLTVHDENVVSVPYNKVGTEALVELQRAMELAYHERLSVPLKVAVDVGANWGSYDRPIYDEMKQGIFNRSTITEEVIG
jgi:DNA polymerase-1